ncbi:hypothetical protein H2200_012450 [Cladophialophora chaetospira]|uniref:Carboxymuconolactone decarboxylase-like domain-containing protein n=1 Tax=Cladophialophora chaetospira TaxID=386627 RepID=A0AA39CCH1_9EURO|nr:hypothetical protein H2200_012450 [Cladophialophora chaetospira]
MRLSYVDVNASSTLSDSDKAVVERILQRRSPVGLQPLDLALLHSPAFIDGLTAMMGAVTKKLTLTQDISELAMARVALLNRAWYGYAHHVPLAKAGGLTDGGIKTMDLEQLPESRAQSGLTENQWAVARYTDAMTTNVEVPDEIFDELRAQFNPQEVVEITGTVAAYNCLSRLLVALNVGEKNGPKPTLRS